MELLEFMAAPIAMCVVLIGIHVQLGLHVVRRGVIFVDIALAQSSALGAAVGVLLGMEVGTMGSSGMGLAAALLAAWIISMTRTRNQAVPQEAYIGITYVVAAAATLLVLSGVPHGGEDIETLLLGSVLWVRWPEVFRTAALYLVLGVFLYRFRTRFTLLSENPEGARKRGIQIRVWDFVFYAVLGIVVSRSVQVAGVYLVFTFLVVPAVMAIRLFTTRRLIAGWLIGSIIAAGAAVLSYELDLPTGATIVCAFGLTLPLVLLVPRRGE